MLKAIYLPDLFHREVPVFTYYPTTGLYEVVEGEGGYEPEDVENNENWMCFEGSFKPSGMKSVISNIYEF